MGDLTLAEVGRTLARMEKSQSEMTEEIAKLAATVHLMVHGPADQQPDRPTGILPRLMFIEQHYREKKDQSMGFWARLQTGLISVGASLVIHAILNWEHIKGGHQP